MDEETPLVTAGERDYRGQLVYGLEITMCSWGVIARFKAFDHDGRPCGAQQIVSWETLDTIHRPPPEP